MSGRREMLLDDLRGGLDARIAALDALTCDDLMDGGVLAAALAACSDRSPLPDALQPKVEADPFADFFGAVQADVPTRTLAEHAAGRIKEAGVPGTARTARVLRQALEQPSPELVGVAATLLGEAEWIDPTDALRRLAPPLIEADAPLFDAVVRADDEGLDVLVELAVAPFRSRLVNELLNHRPANARTTRAILAALKDGRLVPDERLAGGILSLLLAWASPELAEVAVHMEPRFAWTVLYAAVDDHGARPRMRTWLAADPTAPEGLGTRLTEAFAARGAVPGYPIAPLVRWADGDVSVLATWGVDDEGAALLVDLVQAWDADGTAPQRAMDAIGLLLEAGRHAPVADVIAAAIEDGRLPPDPELFARLGAADPPLDGVTGAISRAALADPSSLEAAAAALARAPAPAQRAFVEDVLTLAEAAPRVRLPSRPGVLHTAPEGVDTEALRPLVEALGDAALSARLEEVLPQLGAAE